MIKLATDLWEHVREDFDVVVYGGTALWLGVLMYLNYELALFKPLFDSRTGNRTLLNLIGFYGVPWLGVVLLQRLRGRVELNQVGLWRMGTFAVCLCAFVDWFPYHKHLMDLAPREAHRWLHSVLWNLKTTVLWSIPMLAYWATWDRDWTPSAYGWSWTRFNPRPYMWCLMVIFPLVTWASFLPSFQRQYPTYRPGTMESFYDIHPIFTVGVYEFIYGFDFSFVEMFFRGFLVIGLSRYLGKHAILPMCAMYAVLHFGKPFWETVGSIVGGYILGVFALHSRSIFGGIMLHVGLAWSMELAATLQRTYN